MKRTGQVSLAAILFAILASLFTCGQSTQAVVPNVRGDDPIRAYDRLNRAGFRVSIVGDCSSRWHAGGFTECTGARVDAEPRARRRMTSGSTVVIGLGPANLCSNFGGCIGDRAFVDSPLPEPSQPALMPDLVGEPLSSAIERTGCLQILIPRLPPLRAADKPHLLDNYVVAGQSPAPGAPTEATASSPPCASALTFRVTIAK